MMVPYADNADKAVRLVVAPGQFVVGALHLLTGLWRVGLIVLVPLAAGLVGYCPVWHLTGIKTISVHKL